jgi:8-oxo-dGTP pyrophosphatase MutT (NUDIX family)
MIKQFSTSVVVIDQLTTEPEILFVFHRKFNKWMVPEGHVERSENPMECAVREVKEETGVAIEVISFIHRELKNKDSVWVMPPEYVFEQTIPASAEQEQHIHIDCVYVGVAIRKTLEVNYRETSGVQWIPLSKVWEMDLFDGTKAVIRDIQRKMDSLFQARLANEKAMY